MEGRATRAGAGEGVGDGPAAAGVTEAAPLVVSLPDQSLSVGLAEAVQDVALVVDQLSMPEGDRRC